MEFTKERLLKIQSWSETYGPGSNVVLPAEEAEGLARIALASLEAEPVAYIIQDKADRKEGNRGQLSFKSVEQYHEKDINEHELTATPLYTAPPAPVSLPAELTREEYKRRFMEEDDFDATFRGGWNACRAAMLQGAEPVSKRDESQVVVLHMGQAMSVFEALKKEVLYEDVRHAELGAMGAVNVQVWTSVLGGMLQYETSNGGCTLRVIQAAPRQEVKP